MGFAAPSESAKRAEPAPRGLGLTYHRGMRSLHYLAPMLLGVAAALAQAPAEQGFDVSALDRSANPCANFYQYACGGWMSKNPIPSDQATWGRFNELRERNQKILRQILEQAAANDPKRSAVEQKIGDFYFACMDEKGIEAKGIAPIQPDLERIAALPDKKALVEEIVRLHLMGVNALFNFSSGQDFKDSTQVIAQADQGGLTRSAARRPARSPTSITRDGTSATATATDGMRRFSAAPTRRRAMSSSASSGHCGVQRRSARRPARISTATARRPITSPARSKAKATATTRP